MKLFSRDYTEITADERAAWRALEPERKDGDLFFSSANRWHEFPKAVRHYLELFPNNFLDIVELHETDRLERQVNDFRRIVENPLTTEREIVSFIRENQAYFIVGSILDHYPFGHHATFLFREFPLGTSHQVDYLLVGNCSDGWHFVFIEFEAPYGSISTKNGRFGSVIRKGQDQVADWNNWLEGHYGNLAEVFNKVRNPEKELPGEFRELDKTRLNFVIVAGRRSDFNSTANLARRRSRQDRSELILHYDNLIDLAKNVIGGPTY